MLWHQTMRMIDFGFYHKCICIYVCVYRKALVRKSACLWCVKTVFPLVRFLFSSVYTFIFCFAFAVEPFILYVTSRTDLWVVSLLFFSRSILLSSPSLPLLLHFLILYDSCWFFIFTFWWSCCCCCLLVGPSLTSTTHVDLLWLSIPFPLECVYVWLAFSFRVTVCIYVNIYVMVFGYI